MPRAKLICIVVTVYTYMYTMYDAYNMYNTLYYEFVKMYLIIRDSQCFIMLYRL